MRDTKDFNEKKPRYEIKLAGSGGQGIITAGIILAEAAILEGKFAAHRANYGPEVRGGTSVSEVVLSKVEIDYPLTLDLDFLVTLTQRACEQNLPNMKPEGLVIVDSELVESILWGKVARLPFLKIAQRTGEARNINMAALGALAAFCPLTTPRSLTRVIARRLTRGKREAGLLAFNEGLRLALELKGNLTSAETKEEFEI